MASATGTFLSGMALIAPGHDPISEDVHPVGQLADLLQVGPGLDHRSRTVASREICLRAWAR